MYLRRLYIDFGLGKYDISKALLAGWAAVSWVYGRYVFIFMAAYVDGV